VEQGFQVDGLSLKGFVNSSIAAFPEVPEGTYRVEFKDGGVQVLDSIDEVINLPNVGKKELISIGIFLRSSGASGNHSQLINISHGEKSIVYDISSSNSNWNRSAQVECDEFISGIKRIN
jgi:hypothetical protein